MSGTPIDRHRRQLLLAGLALGAVPVTAWCRPGDRGRGNGPAMHGVLVSGLYRGRGADRRNWLAWLDGRSGQLRSVALPGRGHGLCRVSGRPGRLLVFSRRPGNRLWEIDLREGAVTGGIESGDGYHFYGHGVASRDGRYLFTTENRYRDAAGVIRVRDTNDYRVIDEMPSGGIGPHELALLSDGRTLAVANGGIRTHPAQPRRKLNLDTMDPNLSYLDSGSGELLEQQRLHHHQLSIRHLAVTSDDRVVAVQQFEGRRRQPLPLVLQHRQGRAVETPLVDARELARMNHYTASTAVDAAGDTALVTSPKGNLVTLWDLRHNRLLASHDLLRPYGAAFDGARGRFVMTCEGGEVYTLEAGGAPVRQSMPGQLHGRGSWDGPDEYKWDNHLLWLPINNGERRDVA